METGTAFFLPLGLVGLIFCDFPAHLPKSIVPLPAIPSADTRETQRYSLVVVER